MREKNVIFYLTADENTSWMEVEPSIIESSRLLIGHFFRFPHCDDWQIHQSRWSNRSISIKIKIIWWQSYFHRLFPFWCGHQFPSGVTYKYHVFLGWYCNQSWSIMILQCKESLLTQSSDFPSVLLIFSRDIDTTLSASDVRCWCYSREESY